MQESCALEGDVACSHQEGFSGGLLQAEEVIRGDPKLPGPGNVGVLGSAPGGQDEGGGGHRFFDARLVDGLHGMRPLKAGVLVQVGHLRDTEGTQMNS